MSDLEDHDDSQNMGSDPVEQHDEEMEAVEEEVPRERSKGKERRQDFDEEEDEEEEEDEDDEEEEEEDDEDVGRKGKKRAKHRHKRPAASRFIDLEAEVSDDEDEAEDEEEEYGPDGFIEPQEGDDDDLGRHSHNALLDRKRDKDLDEQDLAQIAQDLSKRYGTAPVRYTGDMNEVPQRLLMPSVHDASLWQVRVKPGRERDLVFSLMRKSIDMEYSAKPLQILSAFQRDSLPGMIYVEARSSQQVTQACNGLVGVYPSRGIQLVPIEEMASLLQIKKQDQTVTPGSWVRIKRGKYQNDLAQVMDITENGEDVGLKFIPRIDLNPRDDNSLEGRKRKKTESKLSSMRPPQRFFNYEEVIKVWGRKNVSKRNQVYVFQNDTYKDGFIEKDFKLSGLVLENVNPTLDEITRFTRGQDGTENENNVDLSIIAEASRKAAISVLQPGDHVEVFEGEQSGVHGVVDEISGDVVTITAVGVDIDGQKVDLPARSVRKRFKPGDHVKVMTGQNADETGLVVSVANNVVTFLSDMSMQEVSVFSKDLREAAEVGSGTNIVGNYELHDLVQLDAQTVGVIFKTERDSFRVLDQNGQVRLVQPHQISMRRDSIRAIATDSEGHELRINDNMKEIDGEGRKGRVLHIHQSFYAFLHNRDILENGGVFVTRARSLASLAPKGNLVKLAGADLSKMNPALGTPTGGMVGSGNMGRGPRDRLIGITVTVVKGAHKGYIGSIKDTNGPIARVELHTGNKVITIEKDKLYRRLDNGRSEPLELSHMGPPSSVSNYNYGGHTPNPYQAGGRTPGWGGGRTPNPYANNEGRTPAWNASSRTPNPYAEGGKTPAWNASSRTPNPYADVGRTPAWNANSRTPNSYGAGGGSSGAPASGWGASGGATPGRNPATTSKATNAWSTNDSTWGTSSSPAHQSWPTEPVWNAPTPATAATPGYASALTPGAPTPGPTEYSRASSSYDREAASAPTPGSGMFNGELDVTNDGDLWDAPETWLASLNADRFKDKLLVQIKGTNMTQWKDTDLEGKKAVLKAVQTQDMANGTHTATVELLETRVSRTLPIKFVRPVIPLRNKAKALVIHGEHAGEEVSIVEMNDSKYSVTRTRDPHHTLIDVLDNMLAELSV